MAAATLHHKHNHISVYHCSVAARLGALAVLSTKSVEVELNFLEFLRLSEALGESTKSCRDETIFPVNITEKDDFFMGEAGVLLLRTDGETSTNVRTTAWVRILAEDGTIVSSNFFSAEARSKQNKEGAQG